MPIPKTLTTKEVARLCCVSDATVKRWEDAGLLNSERTSGGHRRFRVDEVARFQRDQRLGLKNCNGDESVVSATVRRRDADKYSDCELFKSLVGGNEERSANILISEFLNGKPLEIIFDDLLSPALCRIGQLWFEGKLTIAAEHLASRTVLSAIYKLRGLVPVRESNGIATICCSIEGDFHELPTHFVQMILENEGFEVINFGANMPVYSLCDEISEHAPRLICISSTILSDIDRLSRDYRSFSEKLCRRNTSVVLGGRAFEESHIRKRFPADFYAKSFTNLTEYVKKVANSLA